jgi:hypothetical protein
MANSIGRLPPTPNSNRQRVCLRGRVGSRKVAIRIGPSFGGEARAVSGGYADGAEISARQPNVATANLFPSRALPFRGLVTPVGRYKIFAAGWNKK